MIAQPHSPIFDAAVLGVVVSSWFQVIPSIAALLAVVWYVILIWESRTVRKLTGREDDRDIEIDVNTDYDGQP